MDTRKLKADITESANWDRNSIDPRREALTELRADDGTTLAYSTGERNTAELVKQWNAHPELVAALQGCMEQMEWDDSNGPEQAAYDKASKLLASLTQ